MGNRSGRRKAYLDTIRGRDGARAAIVAHGYRGKCRCVACDESEVVVARQ